MDKMHDLKRVKVKLPFVIKNMITGDEYVFDRGDEIATYRDEYGNRMMLLNVNGEDQEVFVGDYGLEEVGE